MMNGLSLIFAVVLILTVAVVAGVLVLVLISSAKAISNPPWTRRKTKLPASAHHHG